MKFKKKILFATVSTIASAAIASGAVIATVASSSKINKNKINSSITFDGKTFNSIAERDQYIKDNSELKTVDVVSSDKYYVEDSNGNKKYLSNSEVDNFTKYLTSGVNINDERPIVVNLDSLKENSNYEFGILDPTWYRNNSNAMNSDLSGEDEYFVYRGNGNVAYTNKTLAAKSYLNSNNEVYYFNDIYFRTTEDLREYLENVYFKDTINKKQTFRIKAPNGQLSDLIDTSSENWQEVATNFVLDYASKLLKITNSNGDVKYIPMDDVESLKKAIDIKDIPYVDVSSTNGNQNWITGLRSDDQYKLSGPVYYSGPDNLSSMTDEDLWTFQSNKEVASITSKSIDYMFVSPTNTWFSNYFDETYSIDESTNEIILGTNLLLFSESNIKRVRNITAELLDENNKVVSNLVTLEDIEALNGESLDVEMAKVDGDALANDYIKSASEQLYNYFATSQYYPAYEEVLSVAQQFASSKSYSFLLKIPLLYYVFMDRLMTMGADQVTINYVREYFYNLTSIVEELLYDSFGESVFVPNVTKAGYARLDLHDLFDISLDGSQKIDFNLQEIAQIIDSVYPNLALACSVNSTISGFDKYGEEINSKQFKNLVNMYASLYYGDQSSTFINDCINALLNNENDINNINNSETLFTQDRMAKAFKNDISLASWTILANDYDNTSSRDSILNIISDEVSELVSANDSWAFVSNDNRFKMYEFYQRKYNNQENKKPSDYLTTVSAFDYRSLLLWNTVFSEWVDEISSSDKYSEIASIYERYFKTSSHDEASVYEKFIEEETIRSNEAYQKMIEEGTTSVSLNLYGGVVQNFATFSSITLMRMLADIAVSDTLFISDSVNNIKVINPEYKTAATKLVFDLIYKENKTKQETAFMESLSWLYRGFQSIQESIDTIITANQTNSADEENILDVDTIKDILKNTAQYSSIINSNMDMLKSMLSELGIKSKTGQIIAYSGSIDYTLNGSEEASFEPNISRSNDLDYSKNEFNDLLSVIPNIYVSQNSNKKLDTYVMPNYSISNGSFTGDVYIANTVYTVPKYGYDFESLDMTEYSFDKYFDTNLLEAYGFDKNSYSVTKDGNWLYYNANDIYESDSTAVKYANNVSINIIKKWGYWFAKTDGINYKSSSSSSGVTMSTQSGSRSSSSYSDQFTPKQNYTLTSITLGSSYNNLANTLENNSFVSNENKLKFKSKKINYADGGISLTTTSNSRFFPHPIPLCLYPVNPDPVITRSALEAKNFARTKYDDIMSTSSSRSNLAAANNAVQSKLTIYSSTTEHARTKTISSDNLALSAKNSSSGLLPNESLANNRTEFENKFKLEADKKQMKSFSSVSYSKNSRALTGLDYDNLISLFKKERFVDDWYFENEIVKINKAYYENYKKTYNLPDDPYLEHVAKTGEIDDSLWSQNKQEAWDKKLKEQKNALKKTLSDDFISQMNKNANTNYRPSNAANKYISSMESYTKKYNSSLKGNRLHRFYQKNIEHYTSALQTVSVEGRLYGDASKLSNNCYENRRVTRVETAKAFDKYYRSFKQATLNSNLLVNDPQAFVKMVDNFQEAVAVRKHNALMNIENYKNKPNAVEFYTNEYKYYRSLSNQIDNDRLFVKNLTSLNDAGTNTKYTAKAAAKMSTNISANSSTLQRASVIAAAADQRGVVNDIENISRGVRNRMTATDISISEATSARFNATNPTSSRRNSVNSAINESIDFDPVEGVSSTSNNELSSNIERTTNSDARSSKKFNARKHWNRFKKFFNYAGAAMGWISTAYMVYELYNMINPPLETYNSTYIYKTDYAEWSWNGGEWTFRGGFYNETKYTRTVSDMKIIQPIKVNSVYEEDFKYFNGKMYKNDDELKEAFVKWIIEQEVDYSNNEDLAGQEIQITDNISIVYSFDNVNENKTPTTYATKQDLANAVVESIKSGNDEKYTTNKIYSISDGYNGSWTSTNDDAAIANAANQIINEIRPSYVSVLPELYVKDGIETEYAGSMGKFDVLPGNSWDSETKQVVTVETKLAQNPKFRSNKFLVDHSANLKYDNNQNNFVEPNKELAAKKSREQLASKSVEVIKTMLESKAVTQLNNIQPNTSYDDFIKISENAKYIEVKSYFDPDTKQTLLFSDTFNKDGTKVSADENFNKYLKYKYNVKREEVITQQTYIVYNNQYYSSMNDLIKNNS